MWILVLEQGLAGLFILGDLGVHHVSRGQFLLALEDLEGPLGL